MNPTLLAKFIASKATLERLKEEHESIRDEILLDMQKNNIEKEVNDVFGSFTRAHKKTWKYSDAITKKTEALKIAKVKEETSGVAKAIVNDYLVYTAPKSDE